MKIHTSRRWAPRNRLPLLILIVPIFLITAQADPSIQESASNREIGKGRSLETILVTAQRTPTTRSAVQPNLINNVDIEHRQSPWVSDLLRASSGVHISQSGPRGALTQTRVRGAEANQLLVLLDGIEINDPALGSEVNFGNLTLTGIQRIEFLPGPQSALWGSDALAGVLALSSKPEPGTPFARLHLTSGSWDTHNAGLSLTHGGDRFYYSVNADRNTSHGTNASLQGREQDGYRNTTLHINAGYSGNQFDISGVFRSVRAENDFDPTPFPAFVPIDGDLESTADQLFTKLSATLRLFDNRWQQKLSFSHLATDNDNFNLGLKTDGNAARKDKVSYQSDFHLTSCHTAQTISLALEYERENFVQSGTPTIFGNPNQHQNVTSSALISDYQFYWNDNTALSLSARYDRNKDFGDSFSYRAALSHDIERTHTKIFLSTGVGIKNPTFTERYGFTPDTFIGNRDLKPEHSESYSVAIEQNLGMHQVLRTTYFRSQLEDEINGFSFDPISGGFTAINESGTSKRQGVEVKVKGKLANLFAYTAGYTWLDATEPSGGSHRREVRRPENSAFVTADRDWWEQRAHIQVGVLFSGSQKDFNFGTFPATRAQLKDYVLVHVAAFFLLTHRIKLTARVENLLAQRYQEVFGYRSPGRFMAIGLELQLYK